MSVRIKICGITNLEDALAAVDAGADALGFVFHPGSPRRLTPDQTAAITRALPPSVPRVGVFVDAQSTAVHEAIRVAGLNVLQFHGDESPEFCSRFTPCEVWKAFRIQDAASLDRLRDYPGVNAWLLDSYVAGRPGGTGAVFNWDLAREATRSGKPLILAGGLTPENVAEAIRHVRPFGVDVSSGVESAPGRKDPDKLRSFIAAARCAANWSLDT